MKKDKSTIILVLVFFVGLSVLLYPMVSDLWNSRVQSRAIVHYEAVLSTLDAETCEQAFAAADQYNAALRQISYPLMNYNQVSGYTDILDFNGNGIIGYLTIDKINVELPVYHGTSEGVLNVAVGHLEGTSLPVGGSSTHVVLSAHRGLPSAKLFSDVDQLKEGDTFTISVLNRKLIYEVDQIHIVLPDEIEDLYVQEGKDYCTLLTCTPYGINTHRLLVRGVHIGDAGPKLYVAPEAYAIDSLVLAPLVAAPMLLMLLIYLLVKYRRKKE